MSELSAHRYPLGTFWEVLECALKSLMSSSTFSSQIWSSPMSFVYSTWVPSNIVASVLSSLLSLMLPRDIDVLRKKICECLLELPSEGLHLKHPLQHHVRNVTRLSTPSNLVEERDNTRNHCVRKKLHRANCMNPNCQVILCMRLKHYRAMTLKQHYTNPCEMCLVTCNDPGKKKPDHNVLHFKSCLCDAFRLRAPLAILKSSSFVLLPTTSFSINFCRLARVQRTHVNSEGRKKTCQSVILYIIIDWQRCRDQLPRKLHMISISPLIDCKIPCLLSPVNRVAKSELIERSLICKYIRHL